MKKTRVYVGAGALLLQICALTNLQSFAQAWLPTGAPVTKWSSLAASADGSRLSAVVNNSAGTSNAFYFSTNSAVSWETNNFPSGAGWNLRSVASSADGAKLILGITGGAAPVYTSTNGGITWISNNTFKTSWISVASSGDGSVLGAVSFSSGLLITSTNAGSTWTTASLPVVPWNAVACSVDGKTLAAAGNSGPIYISRDSGKTWEITTAPSQSWASIGISLDGERLVAAAFLPAGNVYTSTNSGVNWTSNNVPVANWVATACSIDGTQLLVANNGSGAGGPIYFSPDFGMNWIANPSRIKDWRAVAFSADGGTLYAAAMNDLVYASKSVIKPLLNLTPVGNAAVISWTVPSASFVLHHQTDLASQNWTPLTNLPGLNLSTLKSSVTLPRNSSNEFFQLRMP